MPARGETALQFFQQKIKRGLLNIIIIFYSSIFINYIYTFNEE